MECHLSVRGTRHEAERARPACFPLHPSVVVVAMVCLPLSLTDGPTFLLGVYPSDTLLDL